MTVSPGPAINLIVNSTAQLTATPRDAQGNALSGRSVSWSSSAEAVATVSTSGLVNAVSAGVALIRATSEGKTGEVTATVSLNPWSVTGSLATGRVLHTATLLTNGKVLVVGGQNLGPPFETFTSCELYDPATGTWSPTGNLATGRENHIAIRLLDGKVLVAGGNSIELQARLTSAELYDPDTGLWSATGNLIGARTIAEAVLLPNGTVLVAGGSGPGGVDALDSAEIYDPATGTWSPAGTLTVARGGHTATLLANGTVLVAGGAAGTFANPLLHSSGEIYEPGQGTWIATGSFVTPRGFHKAVLLANGKALIFGGSNFVSAVYATADLYDPATALWSATGSMTTARISHTGTLLPNGRVLVAGGISGAPGVLKSVEAFDPATGTWSATIDLHVGRANHAAALLANGKVLVVGGQGIGAATSAEIFDSGIAFPTPPFSMR